MLRAECLVGLAGENEVHDEMRYTNCDGDFALGTKHSVLSTKALSISTKHFEKELLMTIEVTHLNKRFGTVRAVDDVSLRVEQGSLLALLGPSGSGKTTLLRSIAGLEQPDSGSILFDGLDVTDVPAQKRNIGFVFQQYALFKHMRVGENVAFPLNVRRWKKAAVRARVAELLSLLRIDELEHRYPDQLSGGQRQRVALARALAPEPTVLLLDEPFSALDARVRDELREWLRALHDRLHVTSILVTHDQVEAMELADRVVIMNHGQVVQAGTPAEIVDQPGSPFVMDFLGHSNVIEGVASHGVANLLGLELPYPAANGTSIRVSGYFRPQQVHLSIRPTDRSLRARVVRVVPTGLTVKVHLEVEGAGSILAEINARTQAELSLSPGDPVFASPWNLQLYETGRGPGAAAEAPLASPVA